jgi:assimilatory nitrate reductase catalytic subunit
VARRLGWGEAFAYASAADIFDEHARLSGFENDGARAFDISGAAGLSQAEFDRLGPFQWPRRAGAKPLQRVFAEGGFFTRDRKARFVAVASPRLAAAVSGAWPFVLNTGRIRDQWHTMTRTGLSPRLSIHIAEPYVEIHPDDAAALGLEQGTLAQVATPHGAAILRVLIHRGQQRGTLFVPIHWSADNSSVGRIGALVAPATDPFSGQPEAKATPARIAPRPAAFGFLLSRQPSRPGDLAYWASARVLRPCAARLDAPREGWSRWLRAALPEGEHLTYQDPAAGVYRAAALQAERLEAVLFVAADAQLPSPEWLKSRFAVTAIPAGERRHLLAGSPAEGVTEEGPIVCVCFQVGAKRIELAAAGNGSVETIGRQLGADTNCGSCIPEIRRLIASKDAAGSPLPACGARVREEEVRAGGGGGKPRCAPETAGTPEPTPADADLPRPAPPARRTRR